MKKLLIALFCLSFNGSFSQNNKFKFNDRILVNLYHCNLIHHDQDLKIKWYSRGADIFFMYPFKMDQKYFSLALGGGLANQNYSNNSYVKELTHPDTLLKSNTYSSFTPYVGDSVPKRNKIATTYFEFPIELRFQGNEDSKIRKFKVSVGAKAGYLLDMHTKTVDKVGKYKTYIFPNKEKWRFSALMRIGYGRTQFYTSYSINGMFKTDFGEPVNPIAVGITYALY